MSQAWQQNTDGSAQVTETAEAQFLTELSEQKDELQSKVQALKTDLQEWRTKLEGQVKSYKSEIGELRQALSKEVDELRSEFSDLKAALRQQIAALTAAQQTGSIPAAPAGANNAAAQQQQPAGTL